MHPHELIIEGGHHLPASVQGKTTSAHPRPEPLHPAHQLRQAPFLHFLHHLAHAGDARGRALGV